MRRRDAPAAPEIAVDAVAEHFAEGCLRVPQTLEPDVRVASVVLERQTQGVEDFLRKLVVGDALVVSPLHRTVDRRAQQADLDEVVEMPRLERRVLPIVSEAEELPRLRLQVFGVA